MTTSVSFATAITNQKYAHTVSDGAGESKETWDEIADRVSRNVMGAVNAGPALVEAVRDLISKKILMPGGRYLYASGRPFHQVQNCYEGSTRVVTRDGTKTLAQLAGKTAKLMTTDGHWVEAPVLSFGEQPLMQVTLSRAGVEKVIYATPGHSWRVAKNENKRTGNPVQKTAIETQDLVEGMRLWSVFGYGLERSTPSVAGIQHGIVFGDGNVPRDDHGFNTANVRLCGKKDAQLLQYFAGYPTRLIQEDVEVSLLPRRYKKPVSLDEDRAYLYGWLAGYFAADGCVSADGKPTIASVDRENLQLVKDVCYLLGVEAFSIVPQDRISNLTGLPSTIYNLTLGRATLTEAFFLIDEHRQRFLANPSLRRSYWTVKSVTKTDRVEEVFCATVEGTNEFVLEDNILTGNCLLLTVEDSREGWSDLLHRASMALMTGAGIGVVYSKVRAKGSKIEKTGGVASGPTALMQMLNETGRHIQQGGSRRSAIWAGLHWNHPDIFEFITMKDWNENIRAMKAADYNFPAPLDGTNISVILDDDFFAAFGDETHGQHKLANDVYWMVTRHMLETAEPGFSVDVGENAGEHLRNACTEVTSRDDNDVCNLASINMANIQNIEQMRQVVSIATAFLMAGTVYSDLPYEEVNETRTRNRRLGLGLMGLHEFLLRRGLPYAECEELGEFLEAYKGSTEEAAKWGAVFGLSTPIKTRAIAPTGTIGIVAETTTGIEPIFCVAYKRRYLVGDVVNYQYVVDPCAARLIAQGVRPEDIEDAYVLAANVEKRLAFQAWVQQYVDHGISSTINIPAWGSKLNNESRVKEFGDLLIKYLPKLRGVTCYPDGSRGGQPLSPVPYSLAANKVGEVFYETVDICDLSRGGSCGA